MFKNSVAARLNKKVRKLLATKPVKVITVTGSVGKTSTKIAIGKLLSAHLRVNYSEDSYNTDIGLPLSLFGLKAPRRLWGVRSWAGIFKQINHLIADYPYDVVILELADDELVAMQKFLRFITPDIGVLTAVAPVHMARMRSMERIVDHAWQLTTPAQVVYYNADQPELRKVAESVDSAHGFGLQHGVVQFGKIARTKNGRLKAELTVGKQTKTIQTQQISHQGLYSLLAAAAVGSELELPFNAVAFELEHIAPTKGRMNLLAGLNQSTLIDDSYNSSPDAAIAALNTLDEYVGRKIAVLGSMNELGEYAVEGHANVGAHAAKIVDLLVVIGRDAEDHMVEAALNGGLDNTQVKIFRTPYEAGHYLKGVVQKGDVVLIKGSQNKVYTEEVARILLDPRLKPAEVLVRQDKVWQRRKKKAFAV